MEQARVAGCGSDLWAHAAVRRRIALWLMVTALAAVPGCSRPQSGANPGGSTADIPVPVRVAQAAARDIPVQLCSIARVEACQTVTVRPQVAGQITEVHFTEGQDVRAGDLLFSIDPRPFEAALRRAEGNLARDTALARDAEAEAAWQADLFQRNVATQRELEKSRAAAEALWATVRADQAVVEQARLDLQYCSIRCPLDGRTGAIVTHRGNIVEANKTALVTITQVSPIYVAFAVPEQHLVDIKRYQAQGPLNVEVRLTDAEAPPERGALTFIDNQVDSTTGTILVKATFANEKRRLWPGQFVNAVLTLTTRTAAVVVPSEAVQSGQKGPLVFVVQDNRTVELRPVVVGTSADGLTIIEQGVHPGETVVTDGQLRLVPGARVEIKRTAATTQEASR